MCGICGEIRFDGRPASAAAVERMVCTLEPRGPDGAGVVLRDHVAFGQRRLIAVMDSAGPFDWHLTHKLIRLCEEYGIPHRRDVFRYYRSDSASAVDAGNDLRTGLACFGTDASHGWERTHVESLRSLAELLGLYMLSAPTFLRDRDSLTPLDGFPSQPTDAAGPGGVEVG